MSKLKILITAGLLMLSLGLSSCSYFDGDSSTCGCKSKSCARK